MSGRGRHSYIEGIREKNKSKKDVNDDKKKVKIKLRFSSLFSPLSFVLTLTLSKKGRIQLKSYAELIILYDSS